MRNFTVAALAVALAAGAPFASSQAQVEIAVRSVRVGADDVWRTAAFYQNVFGLKEIQRIERPDLKESIMNFGQTVDAARASKGVKVVVISRPAGTPKSAVSNIILHCSDMAAVLPKVTANGGTIERQPTRSATSGSLIAFVVDPAGNRIELIQPPA
jgi:predicted enzyme related to lactoylglutathione lyase